MKEPEWLACTDPTAMLGFLAGNRFATDRKLRLFEVACCRRVWNLLPGRPSRTAVEVAERYADGLATREELSRARGAAGRLSRGQDHTAAGAAALAAGSAGGPLTVVHEASRAVWAAVRTGGVERWDEERQVQAELLRDLFGPLPFRTVTIAPALLQWNDGTAARLAQAAYANRQLPAGTLEQERLLVLADALEDAGCRDQEVLAHLREPGGVHVRGCYLVDLLLGKS